MRSGTPNFNRRNFLKATGAFAACPLMTEASLAWADTAATTKTATAPEKPFTRISSLFPRIPAGAVLINANENPLGPSAAALKAMAEVAGDGGRYDLRGETLKFMQVFATQNKISIDSVLPYAGSTIPLHTTVLAFTSKTKSFVAANPTFESPMRAAGINNAKVHQVPLAADYSHDVKAMVAADPNAGIIYICNPNNPTGTITKKADILWALENKPAGSLLLVDEAYIHLSDAESMLDQVAAGKEIIVLRTFSKIYGMAGIRCGVACGRPDLLAKLMEYGFNPMPITSLIAARVSLEDESLIPTRKKINTDIRNNTYDFLHKNNYKVLPSQSNCFMIDVERPGQQIKAALAAKNILIGRTWTIWPNIVRVSVGTPEEMQKFQVAFKEVMTQKTQGTVTFSEPYRAVLS